MKKEKSLKIGESKVNEKIFSESKVFRMSENSDKNKRALVGNWFSSDLGFYAQGYYRGADILVTETKRNPSNLLVYPICFLYRHFIEIAIKCIIDYYTRLGNDVKNTYNSHNSHNLDELLDIVIALTKNDNSSIPEELQKIIRDFNKFDPNSQRFRYTSNKDGNQFFPQHDVIDLGTLQDNMSKVEDDLIGRLIGLKEDLNNQSEINREQT